MVRPKIPVPQSGMEDTITLDEVHRATMAFTTEANLLIGRRCNLDGSTDITMVVTGVMVESCKVMYRLAWMNNGAHYEQWFDAWRVTVFDEPRPKGRYSLTE